MKHELLTTLPRTSSSKTTKHIMPSSNYIKSSPLLSDPTSSDNRLAGKSSPAASFSRRIGLSTLVRSLLSLLSFPAILPTRRWVSIPTLPNTTTRPESHRHPLRPPARPRHLLNPIRPEIRTRFTDRAGGLNFHSGEGNVVRVGPNRPRMREVHGCAWASGEAVWGAHVDYVL
ncbi:hypothetical protein LOK49_LG10G02872 [Camellia lanceoleosa]|uniref:Uncharacterized protein n=1 Tax=Camellia lanceoleosa TaxID=1840588 RepID=A0ACC0GB47_9ERIC|nr:hypothetical protein LOK49_LG10G02872 [Camellia lanceoleosa]